MTFASTYLISILAFATPDDFMTRIKQSGTEGLVVLKEGKVVESYNPTKRVHIQSITKTFTSLATGLLLKQGKLTSIDVPVSSLLPQLANDPKGVVTLRHLLTHSSGIKDARNEKDQTAEEYKFNNDYLSYTLRLPMASVPGEKYYYNNAGVMLLSAALEKAAGEPLQLYINKNLFAPLGITSAKWMLDKTGRCPFFYGLSINAGDLAKVGQMILEGGKGILTPEWIEQSTSLPGNPKSHERVGLIWFFQPSQEPGKPIMIQHSGDGGSWLIVFPKEKVVVVRLRTYSPKEDTMTNFPSLAYQSFAK